jgi:hypothetical protein
MTAWEAGRDPDPAKPAGQLLNDLGEELRRLAHAEVQLAMTEARRKGKRAKMGVAAFGAAAVLGLGGFGVLLACASLALALVLPGWLAALLVGVVVLALAGICALIGRSSWRRVMPLLPQWTMTSVREDIETIAKGVHR